MTNVNNKFLVIKNSIILCTRNFKQVSRDTQESQQLYVISVFIIYNVVIENDANLIIY